MSDITKTSHNLRHRIIDFNKKLSALPVDETALLEDHGRISQIFEEAGIVDREAYLAWVKEYKSLTAEAAQMQRDLRVASRNEGHYEASVRADNKCYISRMTLLRRASKIAAGISHKKQIEEAAAAAA